MKISEIIKVLEEELRKRGDVEVMFCGAYGSQSDEFAVARMSTLHQRIAAFCGSSPASTPGNLRIHSGPWYAVDVG